MTNIYLVRHCESFGNTVRIFQGHYNTEVTESGKKQLNALSERFKNKKVDVIISSPLKRTMATAEAINKYHNLPIIVDNDFIELNGGELEGLSWSDIKEKYPESADNWVNNITNFKTEQGEAVSSVAQRGYNAILKTAKKYPNKTVAVATHGGLTRFSMSLISGNTVSDISAISWPTNTGVTLLQFDDNFNCTIKCYNDTSHLKDIEFTEVWSNIDAKFNYSLSDKWSKEE